MIHPPPERISLADFLAWEQAQEHKHELLDGEIGRCSHKTRPTRSSESEPYPTEDASCAVGREHDSWPGTGQKRCPVPGLGLGGVFMLGATMPTIKTYTLNARQIARLDRLAEGNDFWRSIREKYAEYESLTQKLRDRLRDELGKDKLPKLPSHDSSERVGVVNKILRDNKPGCGHCRTLATVAVRGDWSMRSTRRNARRSGSCISCRARLNVFLRPVHLHTFIALAATIFTVAPARAEVGSTLDVSIKATASTAPVALVSCEATGNNTVTMRVGNRSTRDLTSITYRLRGYDSQGARFLDTPLTQGEALDAGEVGVFSAVFGPQPDERRIVCSIEGATFRGGLAWAAGQPWRGGKLVSLASRTSSSVHAAKVVRLPAVQSVAKEAWTTTMYGSMEYVHVRTVLTAHRDVTVTASEFHALVPLSGGGARSFTALASAAPSVTRPSALTQLLPSIGATFASANTTHPAVAPTEDLGAIGQLHLEEGERVTTVITFQMTGGADRESLSRLTIVWQPSAY